MAVHTSPGFAGRAARGGLVTLVGQGGRILVQLLGLIVLSRLLPPEVFGAFALITAIVALGELVRDFGITNAAIRAPALSRQLASNVFWISTSIGAFLMLAAVVVALVVGIFSTSFPVSALMVSSIVFLLNGAQAVYQALLARAHRFTALSVTDFASQLVGLGAAVAAAIAGAELWALIAQFLTVAVCLLVLRGILAAWLPGLPRRAEGTRELLRFGTHVGLAQLLGYAAQNTDTYAINFFWGATALGYYSRAFQLLTVPVNQLLTPLTNVFLPLLSKAAESGPQRLADAIRRTVFSVSVPCAAVFIVFVSQSDALVSILLGAEWMPSAPILTILATGGVFQVFAFVGFWTFLASGASAELLRYNLVTKPMTAAFTLVGASFGPLGAAIGYSASLALSWPICYAWLAFRVRVGVGQAFRVTVLILACAIASAGLGLGAAAISREAASWLSLVIGSLVSFTAFAGLLLATSRGRVGVRDALTTMNTLRSSSNG